MGINMEMQDFWSFIVNAILFFLAFKAGQISILVKMGSADRKAIQADLENKPSVIRKPVIKVEEIDGVFYAYDGNDFLAQGRTADELGQLIAQRYPNKYRTAKVEIKA
jgi:hypothetical protein